MKGRNNRRLALVGLSVDMDLNAVVGLYGEATSVLREAATGRQADVGDYLGATRDDESVKAGAALGNKKRSHDFACSDFALRAVFVYIYHLEELSARWSFPRRRAIS